MNGEKHNPTDVMRAMAQSIIGVDDPATDPIDDHRHNGIRVGELRAAYDRIRNPVDWKAPIDAILRLDQVPIAQAAVEFFTATKLRITTSYAEPRNYVRVQAIGYRAGPAGDH